MTRGIFVNNNGTWETVKVPSVVEGGSPTPIIGGYTNVGGVWKKFWPPVTIPVTFTVVGGGGGGGGNDSHPGSVGFSADVVTSTMTLNIATDVIDIYVGGGGQPGATGASTGAGAGGNDSGSGYTGGTGGEPGNEGGSGAGGGGGAASEVNINGTDTIVAAGGGGGGGGGNNSNGRGQQGYVPSGSNAGGAGQSKTSGGEHTGGGSIICTKLYELGYLSDSVYQADELFGAHLRETDPNSYYGYLKWAGTVVDWIEGSGPTFMFWIKDKQQRDLAQKELVTRWTVRIATPWAHHMAYVMGAEQQDNRAGKIIMSTGRFISRLIGKFSKTTKPSEHPAIGYVLWATFGIFWLLAGIK